MQGAQQRPTTPSRRRKATSSASKHSPCSQPLRAVTSGDPTTSKRSLSRRTSANITPNHNPNFQPPSPGKTPEAVPVNASPSAKRSRRSHKALPSPVSTGALLRASSEADRNDTQPRIQDGCGKALEYGESPADIQMHETSPSLPADLNGNRHSELLNVQHSPLTGRRDPNTGGANFQRSAPGASHVERSNRMTPPSVRGSVSLMRVPEGSEVGGEPDYAPGNNADHHNDADVDRRSLRKSLLSIDPMRLSYGAGGLVNLAGVHPLDCSVFVRCH